MTVPKPFHEVWNEAEALVAKKYGSASNEQIINEIKAELDTMLLYDKKTEFSADTKKLLKARSMGAILFLLCAISERENINTWAALRDEAKFSKIDLNASIDPV
jgi:hypothetical protein